LGFEESALARLRRHREEADVSQGGHGFVVAADDFQLVLDFPQPLVLLYVEDHADTLAFVVCQVARFHAGHFLQNGTDRLADGRGVDLVVRGEPGGQVAYPAPGAVDQDDLTRA
jgi:hypothetical protein